MSLLFFLKKEKQLCSATLTDWFSPGHSEYAVKGINGTHKKG